MIRFDFSDRSYGKPDDLDEALDAQLEGFEKLYGIKEKTGRQVVILVDEYDQPFLDNLGDEALSGAIRRQLEAFYGALKVENRYIRFGFLTGVTKISLHSAFGGLNNLVVISMDACYADICGFSGGELRKHFDGGIAALAEANGMTMPECYGQLANMYGGYHFCANAEDIYTPFSMLNALNTGEFREYWIETGAPSYLIEMKKRTGCDFTETARTEADYSSDRWARTFSRDIPRTS